MFRGLLFETPKIPRGENLIIKEMFFFSRTVFSVLGLSGSLVSKEGLREVSTRLNVKRGLERYRKFARTQVFYTDDFLACNTN